MKIRMFTTVKKAKASPGILVNRCSTQMWPPAALKVKLNTAESIRINSTNETSLAGEVNAHMRVFQKAVVRTQHKDGRKQVPPDVQQAIGALGEQSSNKGIACADDGGGKINHMVSFSISLLIWSISRDRDSRGVMASPNFFLRTRPPGLWDEKALVQV
jgi:hypothetical protein